MGYWRTGLALLLGTVLCYVVVYATQVLPVTMGWEVHDWDQLGAGLLLLVLTFGALGLTTLALALMALGYWRRREIRTSGRRRVLAGATVGTCGLALYAYQLMQS